MSAGHTLGYRLIFLHPAFDPSCQPGGLQRAITCEKSQTEFGCWGVSLRGCCLSWHGLSAPPLFHHRSPELRLTTRRSPPRRRGVTPPPLVSLPAGPTRRRTTRRRRPPT